MYNDACVAFVDTLRRHQLLAPPQLGQLPGISYGCADERALAKVLVQRGWLTIYQVNQILEGKAPGLVIAAYRVLDRLGQGGLSQVYKARHAEYDWTVALKLLKSEVLASAEGRHQFLQEMEAMARLNHSNIVQFCDVDQAGETFFYAMEFVDGTDLGKYVGLSGPLPVPEAVDYIRQTALGLQHAHEHSLVHRDIKSVNLFLTKLPGQKHPLIKILDWGLASLRSPGGDAQGNGGQGLIGTADYLPPEQARSSQSVDIRGDIYSLGCTLYYLLTGQPPFPDGTVMQKVLAHQQSEPRPVESFRDDVPAGLSAVLKRMLAKNPDDRYQTPCAVTVALGPYFRAGNKIKRKSDKKLDKPPTSPASADQGTPLPNSLADIPSRADRPAASTRNVRLGPDTMFPYRTS
jgi:serine/threonine-protein kinase